MSFATLDPKRADKSALKLDIAKLQSATPEWPAMAPLATPSFVPLPSSTPATPYIMSSAEHSMFSQQFENSRSSHNGHDLAWTTYGFDDKSPLMKNLYSSEDITPRPLESQNHLLTSAINHSISHEKLQSLEQTLEPLEASTSQAANKLVDEDVQQFMSQRRRLLKRHSSDYGVNRHTRLHSYGANFDISFQMDATLNTGSRGRGDSSRIARATSYAAQHAFMPPPSNKLLRTIIDAIPVHVFTAAPHTGEFTWVNSRMLTYRGSTAEEFMMEPLQAMHPEDKEAYMRSWSAAVRKGEAFSFQMRLRRFDGNYRWFMTKAVPLRDSRGAIVHWFGTNMDVHDQRLAELNAARQAEMAESEMKYRSLANSSPQIVFAATAAMGITFANNQWLEYSGQTAEEALQLGFMEAVHPDDRQKCSLPGFSAQHLKTHSKDNDQSAWFGPATNKPLNSVAATDLTQKRLDMTGDNEKPRDDMQTPLSTELRLKDRNGNYRWHLVRCVSVEANVEGLWFGTCTDINDHKLLEQKLKEANEAAQKSMELKTRFLSNMSHEIRTPLIGISGMVNFLLDTPLNGEQLDYCHTISSSSDGLLMVINDILDLSKVEAGMMRLTSEWFQVRGLVEDANELLSTMAISKGLELNYLVEDDVPLTVSGDRVRLRQVILNVVGVSVTI